MATQVDTQQPRRRVGFGSVSQRIQRQYDCHCGLFTRNVSKLQPSVDEQETKDKDAEEA